MQLATLAAPTPQANAFRRGLPMVYRDLSIFSGTAHPELAHAVCGYLGVPLGKAEVVKFSNENIFPKINQNVREHDVFVIQPTFPDVSDSILELLIMIDALKRASASRITAVVPYFSYARSDKKDQPRVPITARLIADMLQTAGANRLLTIDLHAGQVQGFFNIPVDELTAMQPLLRDYVIGMELIDPVGVAVARRSHLTDSYGRVRRGNVRRARLDKLARCSRYAGQYRPAQPAWALTPHA